MATKVKDDTGQVLVQVQEDLRQLKRAVYQFTVQGKGQMVDVQALDTAIHRTENGLRKHAEQILRSVNREVLTLPSIEDVGNKMDQIAKWRPLLDNIPLKQPKKCVIVDVLPEEKHKVMSTTHMLLNPGHPESSALMQKNCGIDLPELCKNTGKLVPVWRVSNDPTMKSLAIVPISPRNRMHFPSSLSEDDTTAVVSDKMCKQKKEESQIKEQKPARQRAGPTHAGMSTMLTPPPSASSCFSSGKHTTPGNVKLKPLPPLALMSAKETRFSFIITDGCIEKGASDFSRFRQHYFLCWGMLEDALGCLEKLLRQYAVPVAVVDGDWLVTLVLSGELEWGCLVDCLLSALENWEEVLRWIRRPGQRYKGEGGMEAAAIRIQACWRHHRVRAAYLLQRHRRWAAGIISISWLMHIQMQRVRRALQASRQRHLCNFHTRSKYLADHWTQIMSSRRTVIHIPSLGYLQPQRGTMADLDIQQSIQIGRLCDIHGVCSLCLHTIRGVCSLCLHTIRDRNVEVIYVSPVELGDDLCQYYSRLLELQQGTTSGEPEACQGACVKRFTILTPEALSYFPTHNMCLSTLVKYSPLTLHRIRKLIQGKQAYMLSGFTHMDDLAVADELGVPLLGTEPTLTQFYGTKSGGRRLLSNAGVTVPPGQGDISTAEQLHQNLAQLITDNMEVQRWLFKIDNEFGGRGTAYCDVFHLKCYTWAQQEYSRYGPARWPSTRARELVQMKVLEAVPELLAHFGSPVNTAVYSTWDQFVQLFLKLGGVIEAYPPSDNVACLSADLLVEPGGSVTVLSSGDHLHGSSLLETAGSSVPQRSISPHVLFSICTRVGHACYEHHIRGHLSLDLAVFVKPHSSEQQVWVTDLDLGYSNQLAMTKVLLMMTGGQLDCLTGRLEVPVLFREGRHSQYHKETQAAATSRRYAVMSSHLRHTNLSMVHYGVFFHMCKAQGIGFDIKEKQGTLFVLHDSKERNSLGMLVLRCSAWDTNNRTVAESLQEALSNFTRNMSIIHQEISAPNMQGETNFKDLIREIKRVLGLAMKTAKAEKVEKKTKT